MLGWFLSNLHLFYLLPFQIGKVSKALEICRVMKTAGIKHNLKTYSMLISGFMKLKDWANAFSIFEDITKLGLKPDVILYNNIVKAFCGMGNMDRALGIVKQMQKERHRPTTRTFLPIIHGFARAGETRRALEIFDMMRRSGCIPTVHTYNALILGLVEKRQVTCCWQTIVNWDRMWHGFYYFSSSLFIFIYLNFKRKLKS